MQCVLEILFIAYYTHYTVVFVLQSFRFNLAARVVFLTTLTLNIAWLLLVTVLFRKRCRPLILQ